MNKWHINIRKELISLIIKEMQPKTTIRYNKVFQTSLNKKNSDSTNAVKNTEDLDHSSVLVGMESGTATLGNSCSFL